MSFDKDVRDIMKKLGMQNRMTPVKDVYEARNTDLLSVVKIKKNKWRSLVGKMWSVPMEDYRVTQHRLRDLLQGGDMVDFGNTVHDEFVEVTLEKEFSIGLDVEGTIQKDVVDAGAQLQVATKHSMSSFKLEMRSQKLTDILNKLENSRMNEKLVQHLTGNSSVKLGFVYELLKSPGPVSLHMNIKRGGSLKFILANITKVGASVSRMENQKVTLPSNSTVAFAVHPLTVEDKITMECLESDGLDGWNLAGDFKATQQKVKEELVVFENMSLPVKKDIRELMFRILSSPQSLHPLDWMLAEGYADEENFSRVAEELLPTVKELLTVTGLFPPESAMPNDLLKPLSLLVSALTELDEEAVAVMVALEPKVLEQIFHLIEGVMEKEYRGERADLLQWSDQYPESTRQVAEEVLKACEVVLDEDQAGDSERTPHIGPLSLYISLLGLTMLLNL